MKANANLALLSAHKVEINFSFSMYKKKLKGNTVMNLDNYEYQCSIKHGSLNSLFY